jgi:hypothetical protein
MREVLALAAALSAASTAPTPAPTRIPGPTFCAEWVRQSNEGYDRLTLFRDGTLVWKTSRGEKDEVKRESLSAAELQFYCEFFARSDLWTIAPDRRTGLTGQLASSSAVTLARPNGDRITLRFDEFSTDTAESSSLRSALEGLKGLFLSPLPPATRFHPDLLPPGTLLKRFDGAVFQVRRLEKQSGFVEIVGVTEPYSQFLKIEELRFQFSPPEPRGEAVKP